jgi:spermidine/putrescine transport system ATP-binding protein
VPVGAGAGSIVRLAAVSKTYDQQKVRALDRVDLDIFSGEFFSLLGPSGSGKSTTLRLIAGFEVPDIGRVYIDGADVTEVRPYHRDVNTVFQSYALFPHMTVAETVAYPLKMKRIHRRETSRRVADALELVDMTGYEERLPHQLSGGQRQRIALARALVGRPTVVLLDEPLGALDLKLRQQMQIVLKELQREVDITFVYVTHDQGEALSMSDRLAVMNAGRIEQLGTPEEIYYRPDTRFVAGFIGRSNLIDCRIEREGDRAVARRGDFRVELAGAHPLGDATLVIRWEVITLAPSAPTSAGENRLSALVENAIFHGEGHEVILCVGDVRLTALAQVKQGASPRPGDRVEVAVDRADIAVIVD